jgi:sec-independent protein translocase protein TatB
MFDVSFFELLVIGVVALVVIGPERLPEAFKTCALWIGRMKRILAESRSEFEKHIGADDIRRELHNEEILASLEKLKASRDALEQDLLNYQNTIQAELHAIEHGETHHQNPPSDAPGSEHDAPDALLIEQADNTQASVNHMHESADHTHNIQDTEQQTKHTHD